MRVCVSKIIPGRVHKCVHGVSFPSRWALASDRRDKERVGKGRTGEKKQQKKQADKLESEQMNDVCLYAQRKWLIM